MILKLYLKRLYLSALIAGGMIIASSNITYASEVPNQEPAYTKTADNEEPSADYETEKEKRTERQRLQSLFSGTINSRKSVSETRKTDEGR